MTVGRFKCPWLFVLVLAWGVAGSPTPAVGASANAVALSDAAKAGIGYGSGHW